MNILQWIGTISGLLGALLVAIGIFFIGYLLFIISSVSWVFAGIKLNNSPITTLNIGFFVVNVIGFINLGLNLH